MIHNSQNQKRANNGLENGDVCGDRWKPLSKNETHQKLKISRNLLDLWYQDCHSGYRMLIHAQTRILSSQVGSRNFP